MVTLGSPCLWLYIMIVFDAYLSMNFKGYTHYSNVATTNSSFSYNRNFQNKINHLQLITKCTVEPRPV